MENLDNLTHQLEWVQSYIGSIVFIVTLLIFVVYMATVAAIETYKAHSDDYKYDFDKHKYVRIKDNK